MMLSSLLHLVRYHLMARLLVLMVAALSLNGFGVSHLHAATKSMAAAEETEEAEDDAVVVQAVRTTGDARKPNSFLMSRARLALASLPCPSPIDW